jgi:hypothetical protein
MSVLITMVAAFATIIAITRWQTHSAHALGKVSAVVSVTAAFAEAWSKSQVIAKRLNESPTLMVLPQVSTPSVAEPSVEVARREPNELDEFFDENPSFRTGGLRGYSAYTRRP